ncbi:MAG TPA: helix-turn-helix transcriptional regulator [Fibrobacteraceae bacterium]|jgi:DNA-binding XRE family transcriptional regulator|nr:helix-turn-helix transcriptional regulator [Fibrobacteraceae bacterium]
MEKIKKKKLEAKGWTVGDIDGFLGLDEAEMTIVEMKVALAKALVEKRKSSNVTQVNMAKIIGSSQSRVAKIEKADSSVSLELMIKSFLSLGATKKDIVKVFDK